MEDIVEENASLSEALTSIQRELSALSNAPSITIDTTKMFASQQKLQIECTLLPFVNFITPYWLIRFHPQKFVALLRVFSKRFLPSLDVEHLQLPKERCAGYMREEELTTISMAHKATVVG